MNYCTFGKDIFIFAASGLHDTYRMDIYRSNNTFNRLLWLSFIVFFTSVVCVAQKVDFAHYQSLQSRGSFPEALQKVLSFTNAEDVDTQIKLNEKALRQRKEFLLDNDLEMFRMLQSGKILFGDTLTQYIGKVAAKLLEDDQELYAKLNFFAIRDPDFNSFSTSKGFIFVNTGMLANLSGESELAYVLAHEIAHYLKQHPLESHLENIKIIKGKEAYRFTTFSQKLDLIGKRNRQKEFEADSLAIILFLRSGYNPDNIIPAIEHLHYSSVPNNGIPFDKNFFREYGLNIPACYFLDSCAGLSQIKDVYDENYSHPNIFKRREHARILLAKSVINPGSDYLVSEEEFRYIRQVAQFEQVHMSIRDMEYGDAIYNSYVLLQKYPSNKYLEISIAKALYGLAKYKNADKYFQVAEPYEKIEGPSQQLHFFVRQFNRKQLNTLALLFVNSLSQKYPDELVLERLETDLAEDLVIINNVDLSKLEKVELVNDTLAVKNADRKSEQKRTEPFLLAALKEVLVSDTGLREVFTQAYNDKESRVALSLKTEEEKNEIEKQLLQLIRKQGLDIDFKKIIVLDPYLGINNDDIIDEYADYNKKKVLFDQIVTNVAAENNIDAEVISSREMYMKNDVTLYNKICTYTEGVFQKMSHDIETFYPVGAKCFSDNDKIESNILCFIALFRENSGYKYYLSMTDLMTSKLIYWNEGNVTTIEKAGKLLATDLGILKKAQ